MRVRQAARRWFFRGVASVLGLGLGLGMSRTAHAKVVEFVRYEEVGKQVTKQLIPVIKTLIDALFDDLKETSDKESSKRAESILAAGQGKIEALVAAYNKKIARNGMPSPSACNAEDGKKVQEKARDTASKVAGKSRAVVDAATEPEPGSDIARGRTLRKRYAGEAGCRLYDPGMFAGTSGTPDAGDAGLTPEDMAFSMTGELPFELQRTREIPNDGALSPEQSWAEANRLTAIARMMACHDVLASLAERRMSKGGDLSLSEMNMKMASGRIMTRGWHDVINEYVGATPVVRESTQMQVEINKLRLERLKIMQNSALAGATRSIVMIEHSRLAKGMKKASRGVV